MVFFPEPVDKLIVAYLGADIEMSSLHLVSDNRVQDVFTSSHAFQDLIALSHLLNNPIQLENVARYSNLSNSKQEPHTPEKLRERIFKKINVVAFHVLEFYLQEIPFPSEVQSGWTAKSEYMIILEFIKNNKDRLESCYRVPFECYYKGTEGSSGMKIYKFVIKMLFQSGVKPHRELMALVESEELRRKRKIIEMLRGMGFDPNRALLEIIFRNDNRLKEANSFCRMCENVGIEFDKETVNTKHLVEREREFVKQVTVQSEPKTKESVRLIHRTVRDHQDSSRAFLLDGLINAEKIVPDGAMLSYAICRDYPRMALVLMESGIKPTLDLYEIALKRWGRHKSEIVFSHLSPEDQFIVRPTIKVGAKKRCIIS